MRAGRFGLDADLWLRAWIALQRVVVAIVLIVAHAAFKFTIALLFVEEFLGVQKLLTIVFGVAVIAMDAALLVEAVRIFLPEPYGIKLEIDDPARENNRRSTTEL